VGVIGVGKVSSRILALSESPHRRIIVLGLELKRKGLDVILFTAGQPGLPPASEVLEYMCKCLKEKPFDSSRYTTPQGLYRLREAISEDLKKYGGFYVDPSDIVITTGSSEAMFTALASILEAQDKVVLLNPTYSLYIGTLQFLGAKIEWVSQTVENNYQPLEDELLEKIDRNTKAIIIVSPDNPTGRIIDLKIAKTIMDLAVDYDIWVISDEAYKHMVYEGEHVWLYKLDPDGSRTISLNTFSKDPAMPGFRIGYAYGPKEVIKSMIKLKQYVTLVPNTLSQLAAEYYLRSGIKEKYINKVLPIYREKRDLMLKVLKEELPEVKTIKPPAGMFIFADFRAYLEKLGLGDVEFAEKLLLEKGVGLIPGSAFGSKGYRHFRLSFVTESPERIRNGILKVGEYIRSLTGG